MTIGQGAHTDREQQARKTPLRRVINTTVGGFTVGGALNSTRK